MKPRLIEYNIVLLAENQRPQILNAEYLKTNGVIPDDWEPIEQSVLVAENRSTIAFKNGFILTIEKGRSQIQDISEAVDPRSSNVYDVAKRYMELNKSLTYTSVGTNFVSVLEFEDITTAQDFLAGRLLSGPPWNNLSQKPKSVYPEVIFDLEKGTLKISIICGLAVYRLDKVEKKFEGVIANANFNFPCNDGDTAGNALQSLSDTEKIFDQYNAKLQQILAWEDI